MATATLTQNRPQYTASKLNRTFVDMVVSVSTTMPQGIVLNGATFSSSSLSESDNAAGFIETPEDVAAYVAYLGMRYNAESTTTTATEFGLNTDASWNASWVYDIIESTGGTNTTKQITIDIFEYMENQFSSGSGLKGIIKDIATQTYGTIPRTPQDWVNETTRFTVLLQDQAMFLGNQYISNGQSYNTARIGQNITLNQAIQNTNNATNVSNLNSISQGNLNSLQVTTKLLPVTTQGQYATRSGGGNPQQVQAFAGGNATPFKSALGFGNLQNNSLKNSPVQALSYQGNAQQVSFNQGDSFTAVKSLMNGIDERINLGFFSFQDNTGPVTVTSSTATPNESALGGYSEELLSIEDFMGFNWYVSAGTTIAIEDFEELYQENDLLNKWMTPKPFLVSFETFSTGFSQGSRPSDDKPINCGTGSGSGGDTVFDENVTSQITGSNTDFTTSQVYVSGTLRVYWNGQRQGSNEILELSSSTFRTTFVASTDDVLFIDYIPQNT